MHTHWQSDKERLLQPAPDKGLPLGRPVSHVPILHRLLFALFLLALPATLWLQRSQPGAHWPVGILLALAFATTLVSTCRTLPVQNVFAAVAFILVVAGIVQTVGTTTSIPFGPYNYTDAVGERLFDNLPWMLPLVWVVVVLNCRGVARLILRPWRKVRTYGFRVIGLTCLLAAFFDLGLEPFATRAHLFWVWQPTNFPATWYSAPWINFFGWAVTTLLLLVLATPWLINKKPVKYPPDYHPLIVWLGLNLFFAVSLGRHALWLAVVLLVVESLVVTVTAIRNARW